MVRCWGDRGEKVGEDWVLGRQRERVGEGWMLGRQRGEGRGGLGVGNLEKTIVSNVLTNQIKGRFNLKLAIVRTQIITDYLCSDYL